MGGHGAMSQRMPGHQLAARPEARGEERLHAVPIMAGGGHSWGMNVLGRNFYYICVTSPRARSDSARGANRGVYDYER